MKSISVTLKELLTKVNQFRQCVLLVFQVVFLLIAPGNKSGEKLGFNRIAAFSYFQEGEEYVLNKLIYSTSSTCSV